MQSEQRGAKKDLEWWGHDGGAGSAQWDFRDAESLGDFFSGIRREAKGLEGMVVLGIPVGLGRGHPFLQDVAAQTLLDRGNWKTVSCRDPVVWFKTWNKIFPPCPTVIHPNWIFSSQKSLNSNYFPLTRLEVSSNHLSKILLDFSHCLHPPFLSFLVKILFLGLFSTRFLALGTGVC